MSEGNGENPSKMDREQLQIYCNLIKQRAQFYKEENAKMELIFENLKVLNDERKLPESLLNLVEKVEKLEPKVQDGGSLDKVELEHAEVLRKQQDYASKLKIYIRHYSNLNENLTKQVKLLKNELELSKQNIRPMQSQDLKQLEEKAKKYEDELLKFEKKYPWLQQPEYDLTNIEKHINIIKSLTQEKDDLLKDLSQYQNLAPDITEAKQQLKTLKEDLKVLMEQFKSDQM